MATVLSGRRVLELGEGAAVAFCGKLLADAGARVVKVEPPGGDALRHGGPRGPVEDPERSPLFLHLNTNKHGIVLDLDDAGDIELLHRLADGADVLIDSLPPAELARLRLSPADAAADRPQLVHCSITPYGHHGPASESRATEMTVFAAGGAMYREGIPDRSPLRYAGQMPRTFPGSVAAALVAAALLRCSESDLGDHIDLSEVDCWASHPNQISRRLVYAYSGDAEPREETKASASPTSAGFGRGTYRCLDGYVTLLPLGDRHWPRLVELVGRPDLADDPRFSTREARRDHRAEWERLFESNLAARTARDVFTSAQRAGIPAAPLYDAADVLSDPHLAARDYFVEADHPVAGRLRYPGAPFEAGREYWRLDRPAPLLDEHGPRIRAELARRPAAPAADARRPARLRGGARQPLPLQGLRVVEIAEIWAGPFCGALLGDLGADVIKVEAIQRSARGPVRPLAGAPGYPHGDPGADPWNRFAAFIAINRNKRGLTLDLHSEAGQRLLDRLLAEADVAFTNLSLDAQDSLDLLPARLLRANPRLVVALLTGFGLTGPYRYYRSMGMTLDAASGHSVLRGYPDLDLSTLTPVHHPDGIGAVTALFAICLALERRRQTGQGQVIDLAQLEAAIPHLGEYLIDRQLAGPPAERLGNHHPWMAPHGCFAARDPDSWVAVAVDGDAAFQALCRTIGRPELAGDARYADVRGRLAHRDALNAAVAEWARTLDRFDAAERLQRAGVPAAAVERPDVDHLAGRRLFERGALEGCDLQGHGTFAYPRGPWRLDRSEPPRFTPAPRLGEHTDEVLGGLLGLSPDERRELEAAGVVGSRPLETADAPVPVRRHD